MSARGLVHNHTFIFDGTNYDGWKICMLDHFRDMGPNIEQIVDMGFSPTKDPKRLSLEDEENSYLDTLVSNGLIFVVSDVVLESIMPYRNAHELWTKLQDKYEVSNIIEDDCSPSTSGRDEFSSSSTSPTCDLSQGNDMVSGDRNCIVDREACIDYPSSLSHCNVLSSDLNSSSTPNVLHASVDSPCISCNSCLTKSHVDMLPMSCCHKNNASMSSIACVANYVEDSQHLLEQDMDINGASCNDQSSSTIFCLMAKDSKVSPTLNHNVSHDDSDDDDEVNRDALLSEMSKVVSHSLRKNEHACFNFTKIIEILNESKKIIEEYEDIVEEKGRIEREDANEKADLTIALDEEHELRVSLEERLESLEETNDLIVSKLIKEHEHIIAKYKVLKKEKASYSKDLAKLTSPIAINDDACASNSISCEASILKENVELKAQIELLSSNYRKLEESHGKLLGSHEDILVSPMMGLR